MMRNDHSKLLGALFAGMAYAQTTTVVNNPLDPAISTVYYSVCPTAATTTVTLPTTLTFCPGEYCPGGGPTITPPPAHGDADYTSILLHVTFTGTDGKVTELAEYVTVFDAPCTNGPGMCHATYTVTEECPCHTRNPDFLPSHFTTTVHTCSACGPHGSPMKITQTVPCSTASYSAEVNPTGAYASAGAQASAGAYASAGFAGAPGSGGAAAAGAHGQGAASPGASDGSEQANAAAGADAGAAAQAGSNGSGTGAGAQGAGSGSGSASGPASNNAVGAGAGQAGAGNIQGGNGTSPPITGYTGAADRTMFAVSTLFIAVVGSLAWIL